MKKNRTTDYLYMIFGGLVIGIGVAFVIYGNLGGDAMTTFQQGIHVFFSIDLSLAQIIANAIFVILLFIFFRSHVNIDTIICPLLISAGSKLASLVLPAVDPSQMALRVVYMLAGFTIIGVGIGLGAQTPSGSNPYDGFVLALSESIHRSYSIIRPIIDLCLFAVGIVLHGSFGVGTVIATLFQGYIGNFFIKLFKKLSNKTPTVSENNG
jgi:uncharacterized membrane protein YczE